MSKISSKIQKIGITALTASLLLSNVAFAVNAPTQTKRPEKLQQRLDEAKLRVCEARENIIKNRSLALERLVENILEKFDAITLRVKNYYTNKVVPSGQTLENYDALVSDIEAKKTAVKTAIQKAKDDFKDFECDGDDPKGALVKFRESMHTVKQALKDYKTSIRNLIVAVHSVATDDDSDNTEDNNNQ